MRSWVFFLAGALAAEKALFHYMPTEIEYGDSSRVTADIIFGSDASAQPIKVVMDLGSPESWLWGPGAVFHWGSPYLGVEGPCKENVPTSYDPALSSTATVTNHSSTFGYGGNTEIVTGTQYTTDLLTAVGGSGALSSTFALINYGLFRIPDDGTCVAPIYDKAFLGLSPYTNTTTGPSFRQNLFNTGQVAAKTVFMWFDKHTGSIGNLVGGVLFGAVDTSKYTGPLVELKNVVSDGDEGIYINQPTMSINGVAMTPEDNTTCLVNSGSPADYLPFSLDGNAQKQFYAAFNGILLDYYGIVAFNGACEDIPESLSFTYTFAGKHPGASVSIVMPIRNYARGLVDPQSTAPTCLLNLEFGGCALGAPFLSAATLLADDDGGRVGLAQGGVGAEGTGVVQSSLVVLGNGKSWDSITGSG
ncbi:hypothetical protein B2J93_8097 [Marssonina coronariae]|uniref:Peptidase A1 domain-containing protein n=1 Tax=Diplocarpon coronariae TaxID=2795749 RepID=A0A218ZDI3_9HELO|nr:hypothetical protein B2J93_8097 [Marssonina coronariae]